MTLGEKLKILRLQNHKTLDELSMKSEVSKGLLSQIERNISTPTVRTLEKITKALGKPISDLLSEKESDANTYRAKLNSNRLAVVRKGERKKLVLPREEAQYELLSPDLQRKIQFITVHFPVGAKIRDFFTHRGEECGVILKGKLKGFIGDEIVVLEEGDSIYFDSSIPHRWENAGESEMRAIWSITPPSF